MVVYSVLRRQVVNLKGNKYCVPRLSFPTGSLSKIRIVNQSGEEIGTTSITTNGTLTLCLGGYDADDNLIGYVPATWTVSCRGTLSSVFGTSTVFYATATGIGTITATDGTNTAMATIIVGKQI